MQILLKYSELQDYILNKTSQELTLSYIDKDTFKISKNIKMLFIDQMIGFDLKVESINNQKLVLSHEGSGATELALQTALKYIKEKPIAAALEVKDSFIIIHLDQIEKLNSILQKVEIHNLNFNEENAILEMDLK